MRHRDTEGTEMAPRKSKVAGRGAKNEAPRHRSSLLGLESSVLRAVLCVLCVLCVSVSHLCFAETTKIDGPGGVNSGYTTSVPLSEGNYTVTVTLGDASGESTTTVKAEQRRLMLEQGDTRPGEFSTPTV